MGILSDMYKKVQEIEGQIIPNAIIKRTLMDVMTKLEEEYSDQFKVKCIKCGVEADKIGMSFRILNLKRGIEATFQPEIEGPICGECVRKND